MSADSDTIEEGSKITIGELLASKNRKDRRDFLRRLQSNFEKGKCRTIDCMNKKEVKRYCRPCAEKRKNGII